MFAGFGELGRLEYPNVLDRGDRGKELGDLSSRLSLPCIQQTGGNGAFPIDFIRNQFQYRRNVLPSEGATAWCAMFRAVLMEDFAFNLLDERTSLRSELKLT